MVLARIGAWLLPDTCILCGTLAGGACNLCVYCRNTLEHLGPACPRCATPMARQVVCGACLGRPPPAFEALCCALRYGGRTAYLLQRFKFAGDLAAGFALAHVLAEHVAAGEQPGAVVPVPLHRERLRQRGFNQSLELARVLARATGAPLLGSLYRARPTAAQSGMPDRRARQRNVRGAFTAGPIRWPRHVALVDDVVTTAATVNEAAVCLRAAGVHRVSVWACARTLTS